MSFLPCGERPRILLAATGSVATVKVPEIALRICEFAEVRLVLSEASRHFWDRARRYNPDVMAQYDVIQPPLQCYRDQDEWIAWDTVGDPVMHIQLRDWADLLLIAPLSANTLGKIANGLCDNLLTSIIRAWEGSKPVIVAPAMNTRMWEHYFTAKHLLVLEKELGYVSLAPVAKMLACGDTGQGALAGIPDIVAAVRQELSRQREIPGKLTVTA